jgi:membrane protein DedA with SNARE-associated domain
MDIVASLTELWQAISNFDVYQFIELHGQWFYVVTFIWTFLEGETFVLFAGAAAAQDIIDVRLLIAIAWLGSYCGDQTYFYLGRTFGPRILKRFPKLQNGADKVAGLILQYDIAFILTYRFVYGLRNVSSFAMGLSGLDWKKFAFWNFWAAGIWAVTFSMVGYLFGEVLDNVLGHAIETVMLSLLGLLALFFIGKLVWKKIKGCRGKN